MLTLWKHELKMMLENLLGHEKGCFISLFLAKQHYYSINIFFVNFPRQLYWEVGKRRHDLRLNSVI